MLIYLVLNIKQMFNNLYAHFEMFPDLSAIIILLEVIFTSSWVPVHSYRMLLAMKVTGETYLGKEQEPSIQEMHLIVI